MPDPIYAIAPPAQPSLAIVDSDARFPVRRIFCVGRNYAAHVREMGNAENEPPFFFTKPADVLVENGAKIPFPPMTNNLHFEVELVLALGQGGRNLSPADVPGLIWGCAVGIDLTRRDLQAQAKAAGKPWDMAKAFDHSAPIGPLTPFGGMDGVEAGEIRLTQNGVTRQQADLADMTWGVRDLLVALSRYVALAPGDLVMTGTPDGVGPIARGDVLDATCDGCAALRVTIG